MPGVPFCILNLPVCFYVGQKFLDTELKWEYTLLRMNTLRLAGALLLTLAALAVSDSSAWSESPEPAVSIEPASVEVGAGDTFQVSLEIRDVANLGAFQLDLTHDPAIVEVENINLGDFPGSTGRAVNPLGPRIEAGKVVYGAFSFGDAAGPDGSGTLATITLKALASGQTLLGLENVQVIDISGGRIRASTQGATVTVSGTPPARQPATTAGAVEPTRASTATAETLLTLAKEKTKANAQSASPLRGWAITGAALIGVVVLVIFAARLMAR